MRVIIQKVSRGSVSVKGQVFSSIESGYVLLVGLGKLDDESDLIWMTQRILSLKLWPCLKDLFWKRSIREIPEANILSISQFTLLATINKGTKPDFHNAMTGSLSKPLYHKFLNLLRQDLGHHRIFDGVFGEMMEVELVNQGPVSTVNNSFPSFFRSIRTIRNLSFSPSRSQ